MKVWQVLIVSYLPFFGGWLGGVLASGFSHLTLQDHLFLLPVVLPFLVVLFLPSRVRNRRFGSVAWDFIIAALPGVIFGIILLLFY